MHTSELGRRRLLNQRLAGNPLESAEAVVNWLGAVQSQEYAYAKWSVGQRANGPSDSELDSLVAQGRIIRTHILRPTWHFVTAPDLRWMMSLSGLRVDARSRHRYRQLELDEATLTRAREVIRDGLAGGTRLTRPQIGELLERQGIDVSLPQRREHIVMHAELNLLICSGGLDGRQQTYALVDDLVPASEPLTEEGALAALTRRYFTSHGPSTLADFSWWSGLRLSEARRGLEIAGADLESFAVDGTTYWLGDQGTDEDVLSDGPTASLLQAFDEMIVGYQRTRTVPLHPNTLLHPVVIDGRIVGRWRRVNSSSGVELDVQLDGAGERALGAAQKQALQAEIARCQTFYRR